MMGRRLESFNVRKNNAVAGLTQLHAGVSQYHLRRPTRYLRAHCMTCSRAPMSLVTSWAQMIGPKGCDERQKSPPSGKGEHSSVRVRSWVTDTRLEAGHARTTRLTASAMVALADQELHGSPYPGGHVEAGDHQLPQALRRTRDVSRAHTSSCTRRSRLTNSRSIAGVRDDPLPSPTRVRHAG